MRAGRYGYGCTAVRLCTVYVRYGTVLLLTAYTGYRQEYSTLKPAEKSIQLARQTWLS